ncbi:aconitate hydratase 1 [Puccinia graminis f. sp. tritici CRL 75-36-700-3]|uniref:Aconitate hydratase, mitochondrial n=1 Tax=Puccinia graminis f. sp. tritici (strain CRL 75-36-700-3 / race SCCL) TaxID=418459 RepID=E3K0V5_PUCGT|nr:aconitate hydratase 1 [Puccinia graminis f. sp. tritici CRL 75-36-700-3]EFP77930.2 aconitate hydratase 1 [Puccinia graminis f. sp. tritici CRL 75-36-700-3]
MASLNRLRRSKQLIRSYANISNKHYPSITPPYHRLIQRLRDGREQLIPSAQRERLTLAEKIFISHLDDSHFDGQTSHLTRGSSFVKLKPDRVAMQDASAQMALLQFATCEMRSTAVPTSIHCDHLIAASEGASNDLQRGIDSSREVFDFLRSASEKYGIEFWKPGSGIIHQIVLENYAAPGLFMLGTDSHTPNAGGLGAIAIGVGGADAVDAMTDTAWETRFPKVIGVELKGKMNAWTSPKDLILHILGKLTVRGGTGFVIEYHGDGVHHQSATGLATICNMGAEMGATTSLFPYTKQMKSYLQATNRSPVAEAADEAHAQGFLSADPNCEYDQHLSINLDELEPHINGPHTPDLATPLSKFKAFIEKNNWDDRASACLIGSCTNSSYEDMSRVSSIAKQALDKGLKTQTKFMITPGSEQINSTIARDGIKQTLESVGGVVLANACGPCIGQWERKEEKDQENAILTSFNRNFKARNDGNRKTMNFLASPELVTAMAFSGKLSFNPITDTLTDSNGKPFKFEPPHGDRLPAQGFDQGNLTYIPEPVPSPKPETQISIDPKSSRLEILKPFEPHWTDLQQPLEFNDLKCLIRIQGKCTTDEISAAGKWLQFKGHLSNISENTLIGAKNDENGKINSALDATDNGQVVEDTIPNVAKRWKSSGQPWMVVADYNYGEGSAREHASMQPRFLGGKLILAKSFARIHLVNLIKQGILGLTFKKPEEDYRKISAGDRLSTRGLDRVLGGDLAHQVELVVNKPDGSSLVVPTLHGLSSQTIRFIKAGSALNLIRQLKN